MASRMTTQPYLLLQLLCLRVLVNGMTDAPTPKPLCTRSQCKGDVCAEDMCPLGCKDGYYGRHCGYRCSNGCISKRCSDSGFGTGSCTDGCISGYWGSTCSFECPADCIHCSVKTCSKCRAFLFGPFCSSNCRELCPSKGCNMDGTCRDDEQSIACNNGNFGSKCQFGCNENCAFHACNRSSGVCLHGCETGHFGATCEFRCNTNCKDALCDFQGRCLAGCKAGRYGRDCDEQCSGHCRQRICDPETGYCINGCHDGHYGFHCNTSCLGDCSYCNRENGLCLEDEMQPETTLISTEENTQTTPSVNYVIGSVVFLLVCGTVAVLITRSCKSSLKRKDRRLLSPQDRQLPEVPVSANAYDDINEDDIDASDRVTAGTRNNTCQARGHRPLAHVTMCHTTWSRKDKTGHLHVFKPFPQRARSLPVFTTDVLGCKWNKSDGSWTEYTGLQARYGNLHTKTLPERDDRANLEGNSCLVDNVAYESNNSATCTPAGPRGYLSPVASDSCLDYTDV
ncbi:scavenger receptor class F member 2-like isoform X1 [Haliotis rufescens]|uniref:scavenger receptor class F member 2-like isoform X1 n=2 Tax=Haliotis rufescens TaxID=6454 RepID=UPI00201EF58E|nr:scavenger receptor class F member 2-like isoform X1 [Haliotis rufescens]XP_048255794.1 scavenger receptor class F member 2-like isoform X1 [Haliotis rufescens]